MTVPKILRHRSRKHTIVRIDRKPPPEYIGLFERLSDARELSQPCVEVMDHLASLDLR
ncbi:hypothetical protein [Microbacterium sp. W4I20]|uniref:hypothetical protein n=1 Tax=Microbacterium sp. W4I20 TaxID=3042262 RepID=UPI0027877A02|nr:hypothetical protein [Microbacterium sp. W4I20]MDQ0726733.1 hypothetical protein [Microbacterium sp. W4I20]